MTDTALIKLEEQIKSMFEKRGKEEMACLLECAKKNNLDCVIVLIENLLRNN